MQNLSIAVNLGNSTQIYQYLHALTDVLDIAHSNLDRQLDDQSNSDLLSLIDLLAQHLIQPPKESKNE